MTKVINKPKTLDGYWFVWTEGNEWPSWFYDSHDAEEKAKIMARAIPGQPVYIGNVSPKKSFMLPGELEVNEL